jgi:hypothetical protein
VQIKQYDTYVWRLITFYATLVDEDVAEEGLNKGPSIISNNNSTSTIAYSAATAASTTAAATAASTTAAATAASTTDVSSRRDRPSLGQ